MAAPRRTGRARQPRSDSARAALQAMENVAKDLLQPPSYVELSPEAMAYWEDIMVARPRNRWTEIDLAMACEFAESLADACRLRKQIKADGDLIEGRPNPLHASLDKVVNRNLKLQRQLHCHPDATEGGTPRIKDAYANERQAREIMEQAEANGTSHLIPRAGNA